jgi:hypothetical protein
VSLSSCPFFSLACLFSAFLAFDFNNHIDCRDWASEYTIPCYPCYSERQYTCCSFIITLIFWYCYCHIACYIIFLSLVAHVICCLAFSCLVERTQNTEQPWDHFSFLCIKTYTDNLFLLRISRGPGFRISDFESNRIIGQAQFEATRTVMEESNMTAVSGSVKSVHVYLDM